MICWTYLASAGARSNFARNSWSWPPWSLRRSRQSDRSLTSIDQELHVSIPEESIFLEADPTRLEQILFNLLINAAKYTPQGGRIWLDVEQFQSEVVIRVRDTGIGIEA